MPRKKIVPVEEQENNMEALGVPVGEGAEGAYEFPEGLPGAEESAEPLPVDGVDALPGDAAGSEKAGVSIGFSDVPPEDGGNGETGGFPAEEPGAPQESENPVDPVAIPETTETAVTMETVPPEAAAEDQVRTAEETSAETTGTPQKTSSPSPRNDRQSFYDLNFNELDRDLTAEERQEWNSIYASYRGRRALTGTIIGVDPHSINVRNQETGRMERQTMYCAIVIPYRVRVVIPAAEVWEAGHERPDFVLQNMVGANIDFIITKVDRESGFAIGSRRLAARSQRYFFAHRDSLHREGARLKCRVLSVGPRRCLVECYGHDLNMTQRDLRYTAIPDLRNEYRPGQELDCIVKSYDPEKAVCGMKIQTYIAQLPQLRRLVILWRQITAWLLFAGLFP